MFIDKLLTFDWNKALTTSGASTNYIDTLAAGDAIAPGVNFNVEVITAIASTGAISVTFDLQTATDSAFTSPVTLISSGAIAKASLPAGATPICHVIPPGCLRYLRLYYTCTNNIATGNIVGTIVSTGGFDRTLDKVLS